MEFINRIRKYLTPDELIRLIKFGVTGAGNTLVDYLVFMLLARVLGINAYLSQVCSYSAGMLNSYFINRHWTFRTKQRFFSVQMVKFIVANLSVLAVSILLLRIFLSVAWPLSYAKLTMVCITTGFNFFLSRLWVFR